MKIRISIVTLILLLALNGTVSATLIGDSVEGSITGLNILQIDSQFGSPAIVGSGDEFQGAASKFFVTLTMYWNIYVNVNESSFQVRIVDPQGSWATM